MFQADEKTGRITKDGEDFVTINRLAKELSIANKTISATTDGVFSLKGRDTSGQKTTFYKESELREKLEKSGYFERKRNISEREQREKAEEDLTSLVVEMAEGETPAPRRLKN